MKTVKTFNTPSFLFAIVITLLAILAFSAQSNDLQKNKSPTPVLISNPAPSPKPLDALPAPLTPCPGPCPCPTPNPPELTVFSAKWCGACQHAKPIVNQIERSGIKVTRIDADEQPQLLRENNVRLLPTFIALKEGKTLRTQDVNEVMEFLK